MFVGGVLHRDTSNWNRKLNDTTFLDSSIDPQARPSRKNRGGWLQSPTASVRVHLPEKVRRALPRWSSQQHTGRNQQPKGGGYAGNKGKQTHASKGGNKTPGAAGAATALGLGMPPQQNAAPSGLMGLGMAQQSPLGSLFGSAGTNPLADITGLNAQCNKLMVLTIAPSSLLYLEANSSLFRFSLHSSRKYYAVQMRTRWDIQLSCIRIGNK